MLMWKHGERVGTERDRQQAGAVLNMVPAKKISYLTWPQGCFPAPGVCGLSVQSPPEDAENFVQRAEVSIEFTWAFQEQNCKASNCSW